MILPCCLCVTHPVSLSLCGPCHIKEAYEINLMSVCVFPTQYFLSLCDPSHIKEAHEITLLSERGAPIPQL
jgi:hypothetical protein